MTPDHYFPGTGGLIQSRLGVPPLPALDLRQQCAGFAYGLQTVDALIKSGTARTVLLVGTDVHSSLIPWSERTWDVLYGRDDGPLDDEERAWNNRFRHLTVLFGDAAGAMVFRASGGRRPRHPGRRALRRRRQHGHPLRPRRRLGLPPLRRPRRCSSAATRCR